MKNQLRSISLILGFTLISFFNLKAQGEGQISGPYEVCLGGCYTYVITPSQGDEYEWIISDGSGQVWQPQQTDSTSAVICFELPGTYIIEVYGIGSNGTDIYATITVFVIDGFWYEIYSNAAEFCPDNNDNSDCEKVCEYSQITYRILESQQLEWVEWSVQGAESFEVQSDFSVIVNWGEAGIGQVEAYIFDWAGCESFAATCVEIIETPEAEFETSPEEDNGTVTVCQGQTIYTTNTSEASIYNMWSTSNGQNSTEVNPEFSFVYAGSYTITLIAKNECLCADTTSMIVEVLPAETPNIDCVGTICENETVTYTSDADCTIFNWTITPNGTIEEGGSTSDNFITVNWGNGPEGWVTLQTETCNGVYCNEPAMFQIPIMSELAEIEGPEKVCKGSIINYSIQEYSATYYNWSVSSGNGIVTGQGSSTVTIEWKNTNNLPSQEFIIVEFENCFLECSGTDTLEVTIVDEFFISGDVEVCEGTETTYRSHRLSNTNSGLSCHWELYDPSGAIIFSSASASETIEIEWPENPGLYSIKAIPDDIDGYCNDSYSLSIPVRQKTEVLTGIIGEQTICQGVSYTYEGLSNLNGTILNWYVADGNDTYSLTGNPVNITWNTAGPYLLEASQTDYSKLPCESDPISHSIDGLSAVSINGTAESCNDDFTVFSIDPVDQTDIIWSITPNNYGTVVEGQGTSEVTVQWHVAGQADLKVELCGLEDTYAVTIHPLPEPVIIHPIGICSNELAQVGTTVNYDSYEWKNEDGDIISTDPSPEINGGWYHLVVTDVNGCLGSERFHIQEFPAPNITLSTPEDLGICDPLADGPLLYALESDPPYSYVWYKDNVQIPGGDPTLQTTEFGYYKVEVTDVNGCVNTSNVLHVFDYCGICENGPANGENCGQNHVCNSSGLIDFTFTQQTNCNTYQFTNNSQDYEAGSLNYYFGSPIFASTNDENPSYTFENAGFFPVLLVGNIPDLDNPGDYCSSWRSYIVEVPMAAAFDTELACAGEEMSFIDHSSWLPGFTITSWEWNFDDPSSGANNTSTDRNPTHTFTSGGTYNVRLVISDGACQSERIIAIDVPAPSDIDFPDPDQNCEQSAVPFSAVSPDFISEWSWNFGDPGSMEANESSQQNSFHNYDSPGVYAIELRGINIYGCEQVFVKNVTIDANPLNGNIDYNSPICEGDQTTLTAPAGGTSWLWSNGEDTESITVSTADKYYVTVYDDNGCDYVPDAAVIDLIPKPVSVIRVVEYDEIGLPLMYTYGNYANCYGEDITLEIIPNPNYSYTWSSGQIGNILEFTEERGNLLDPGTYSFTVDIVDNTTTCTNTVGPFEITVHELPDPIILISNPNGYLCEGESATLEVSNPQSNVTYYWSNGSIGTSINSDIQGDYFVIGVNEYGCSVESNIVEINEAPDIGLIPSGCLTVCFPEVICLPSIPNIASYQWYHNGVEIPAPEGTIPDLEVCEEGEYYVELTDVFGCTAISEPLFLSQEISPDSLVSISGMIYFDLNSSTVVDAGDTLMNLVWFDLCDGNTKIDSTQSNENGVFIFEDVLPGCYTVKVNLDSLPDKVDVYDPDKDICVQTYNACNCGMPTDTFYIDPFLAYTNCDLVEFDFSSTQSCSGQANGQIDIFNVIGGSGNYEYSIDGVNYSSNPNFGGLPPDQYTLYVRDDQSCAASNFAIVDEIAPIQFSLQTENSCFGQNNGEIYIDNVSGGLGTVQFSIDGVNYGSVNAYAGLDPNNYTIYAIDDAGCEIAQNIDVLENAQIEFDIQARNVCFGMSNGEVEISNVTGGSGSFEYSIDGVNFSSSPIFTNLNPSNYSITVMDTNGCTDEQQTDIIEMPEITFDLSTEASCWNEANGEILISNVAGGFGNYSYSVDNSSFVSTANFIDIASGQSEVTVQDDNGCVSSQMADIDEIEQIVYQVEDAIIPCSEDETELELNLSQGSVSDIMWSNGENSNQIIVDQEGSYLVEFGNQCESIVEEVQVNYEEFDQANLLYIPNVFSPNSDGVNENFEIFKSPDIDVVQMQLNVFDRWGNTIFTSNDINGSWNGQFGGKLVSTGVYVYQMTATLNVCHTVKEIKKVGDVTVLK